MKTSFSTVALIWLVMLSQNQKSEATDVPVSLSGTANYNFAEISNNFAYGNVVLGGVNFTIPSTYADFNTNPGSVLPDLSVTLNTNIASVSDVQLLISTGNTYSSEMSVGNQIGEITLDFASGSPEVVPLDVGVNIREFAIGTTAQSVINTFTSSTLQNVWTGDNNGSNGILCALDMLTIPTSAGRTLTSITVADQSEALIGHVDPSINLEAVTVQTVPEPKGPLLLLIGLICTGLISRRKTISL